MRWLKENEVLSEQKWPSYEKWKRRFVWWPTPIRRHSHPHDVIGRVWLQFIEERVAITPFSWWTECRIPGSEEIGISDSGYFGP